MSDNRGANCTTNAEGTAAMKRFAQIRKETADLMYNATGQPEADKFAQNAANPQWTGGFDEMLRAKRTTT